MSEHIVSPKIYIGVFLALMVCTGLTVFAATVDLNEYFAGLNVIVALAVFGRLQSRTTTPRVAAESEALAKTNVVASKANTDFIDSPKRFEK